MTWLDSLKAHKNVNTVSQSGQLITIETKDSRPELVVLSNFREKLTARMLQTLINTHNFNFLVCTRKNYYLDEEAINLLKVNNISFGDGKDLFRLLNAKNTSYSNYINKDSLFIFDNLGNHSNVRSFHLTSNRKFIVQRINGREIAFVFINEYVITQERINEIFELYAPFDFVLAADPNARWNDYTYNGHEVKIGLWRELLSFLANPRS